jgi:hypothetical protein
MVLRSLLAWSVLVAGVVTGACSSDEESSNDATPTPDAGSDAELDAADSSAPKKVSEQSFGGFEPWARPIEDYIEVGTQVQPGLFNMRINDLAATEARLWIAYGDADYNLGEDIPIEFRYFASADDPNAQSATIDAAGQGAPQTTPSQSGEEQIDRYRFFDGKLWQAGIDSTDPDELHTQANTDPPGIQGNMYRLDGDTWKKFRSITGGEHVHDLAFYENAVYGVGSGADTRLEFEAGQIFRYLWRSTDQGATFETVQRVQHPTPGQGDTRWVTLLPTGGSLYLFGYVSTFATSSATIANAEFDGNTVTDLAASHPLHDIFPDNQVPLADGTALVWGVDVGQPPHHVAGRVAADGTFTEFASLSGKTVLDAVLTLDGEVLWLVNATDTYGTTPTSWEAQLLVSDVATPDVASQVLAFSTEIEPVSVAYWQGALFLGTGDGGVLRAMPAP